MKASRIRSLVSTVAGMAVLSAACASGSGDATEETVPEPEGAAAVTVATSPGAPTTDTGPVPTAIPPNSAEYEAFHRAPTACGATRPEPVARMQFDAPRDLGLDPATPIRVLIETSCGDLEIDLDPSIAPVAVNSFVFLAGEGYFDGSVSHRIMAGFMFQAGDPTARGNGRPGYVLEVDEWPEPGFAYERGVVAMANAGPLSTGSQFFIMLGNSSLSPNFTVIGRVVGGDEVLDAIAAVPVTDNGRGELSRPTETLYLERVVVAD